MYPDSNASAAQGLQYNCANERAPTVIRWKWNNGQEQLGLKGGPEPRMAFPSWLRPACINREAYRGDF